MFFKLFLKKIPPISPKNSKHYHWNVPQQIDFDTDYLLNPQNLPQIEENIQNRKGRGDITLVHELKKQLDLKKDHSDSKYEEIKMKFLTELNKIPNKTHPDVRNYGREPKTMKIIGEKPKFETKPKDFQEITKRLRLVRTQQLGNLSGSKSYYILGEMAQLEQALIRYVITNLLKNQFQLISVPDILPSQVIEGCGMNTKGERTMVYSLDPTLHGPELCLSGTSEMALAGYLSNKTLSSDNLPLKLVAVSRCYRAETSNLVEERGIYRVHEFTKVEMFVASVPDRSDQILEEIRGIQEEIFENLGLHFQVLDMPPHDLGAQAYRKYDIEAWLAARGVYGEISSCSNCLDFQSRRLGIKYEKTGDLNYVHTLNGTACAVPRLLIALTEMGQKPNGTIVLPDVLQKYMGNASIRIQKKIPDLKLVKNKK